MAKNENIDIIRKLSTAADRFSLYIYFFFEPKSNNLQKLESLIKTQNANEKFSDNPGQNVLAIYRVSVKFCLPLC